jgi:predicted alpha/beta superfamily hydrolase
MKLLRIAAAPILFASLLAAVPSFAYQDNAAATSKPTDAQKAQEKTEKKQLKANEKADKAKAKAAKQQQKALDAQDKANKDAQQASKPQ